MISSARKPVEASCGRAVGAVRARRRRALAGKLSRMSARPDPFDRSDLHMEIRNLMNAARGVGDAEALREKLPQLARHPAITSLPPASGGRPFERSLKAALANAIAGTAEKESTKAR